MTISYKFEPLIETERLILRPPQERDLTGWAAMMADEEASRFIGGPLEQRAAWAGMAIMRGAWALHGFANFSVLDKQSGEWIGRAGPWSPPGWPGHEVGWAFRREFWGRGLASEASLATIAWARAHLGWDEIVHIIHPENLRSIALAQRIGSRHKGELGAGIIGNSVPLLIFSQ